MTVLTPIIAATTRVRPREKNVGVSRWEEAEWRMMLLVHDVHEGPGIVAGQASGAKGPLLESNMSRNARWPVIGSGVQSNSVH
jgi:hypothetical protein